MQTLLLHALFRITAEQEASARKKKAGWSENDFPATTDWFLEFSRQYPQSIEKLQELLEYNRQYAIPGWVFGNLYLSFSSDQNNRVIQVLENPDSVRFANLMKTAENIDNQYRETNASLANVAIALAMTCIFSAAFLLKCLAAVIVIPAAMITMLLTYYCDNLLVSPLDGYSSLMEDAISDIRERFLALEKTVKIFDYDHCSENARIFLGFFENKPLEVAETPAGNPKGLC